MSKEMKPPCIAAVSKLTAIGYDQENIICVNRLASKQGFLGRGGAGSVVRRLYKEAIPVAVKMMSMDASADSVKKEVDIMKLMGEHTAGFLGVSMARNGDMMIVMRCAEHRDLRQFMKTHQPHFVWGLRKRMGLDVARGLQHLHGMGIYHEDVKSQNVVIDIHLRAKLCDFGCSRRRGEARAPGITWEYAAPEKQQQYDEEEDGYDIELSDIYSYGTVLWEMAYLDVFDADSIDHEGDVPPEYLSIVTACVSAHPDHRPSLTSIIHTLSSIQEPYEADGSIVPITRIEMDVDEFIRTVTSASINVVIRLAHNGEVNSQVMLGNAYLFGYEVEQNDAEAFKWFMRAAQQNDPRAQFNVGNMYRNGQGVVRDDELAFVWYMRAAKQDYVDAQYNIGMMYRSGHGVEQDYNRALEWMMKAAEQGYAGAQNNIGMMYRSGHGVEQDCNRAFEWLMKVVDEGG